MCFSVNVAQLEFHTEEAEFSFYISLVALGTTHKQQRLIIFIILCQLTYSFNSLASIVWEAKNQRRQLMENVSIDCVVSCYF